MSMTRAVSSSSTPMRTVTFPCRRKPPVEPSFRKRQPVLQKRVAELVLIALMGNSDDEFHTMWRDVN